MWDDSVMWLRAATVCTLFTCACVPAPDNGTVGEKRRVIFTAVIDDDLFEHRLMVGARLTVVARPLVDDDTALVSGRGELRSSDDAVLVVHDGRPAAADVELIGPGRAYLEVHADDELVDRIRVEAAVATTIALGDAILDGTPVDARLPERFALLAGEDRATTLHAFDRCNTALFVAGDALLSAENLSVLEVDGAWPGAGFTLHPVAPGETVLSLSLFDGSRQEYVARVVEPNVVTSVAPAIGGVEGQTAFLWGRAFVDDDEVVGPRFRWSASPRVTLSEDLAATTKATIAPDVEGVDGGPALVRAALHGDDAGVTIDLYAATTDDIVTERVPMPEPAAPSGGCDDNAGLCDPFAAAVVVALARRRLRVPRRGASVG